MKKERNIQIVKLYAEGSTMREISDVHGITKARVDQIIKRDATVEQIVAGRRLQLERKVAGLRLNHVPHV